MHNLKWKRYIEKPLMKILTMIQMNSSCQNGFDIISDLMRNSHKIIIYNIILLLNVHSIKILHYLILYFKIKNNEI